MRNVKNKIDKYWQNYYYCQLQKMELANSFYKVLKKSTKI
jgi:hypothetical protein